MDHLVHRHGDGGVVAQHHHAKRVADEQDRNARIIEDLRRQVVVCGEHGKALAAVLEALQVMDGQGTCASVDAHDRYSSPAGPATAEAVAPAGPAATPKAYPCRSFFNESNAQQSPSTAGWP